MTFRSLLRSPYTGFIFFAVLLLLIPLAVTNEYYLNVLIIIGINSIIVIGLDLLMGYTGQISLGHAAFYGIGAYVSVEGGGDSDSPHEYGPIRHGCDVGTKGF